MHLICTCVKYNNIIVCAGINRFVKILLAFKKLFANSQNGDTDFTQGLFQSPKKITL